VANLKRAKDREEVEQVCSQNKNKNRRNKGEISLGELWLSSILHVAVDDTQKASQPRFGTSQEQE
jgi:hypothetical protein